LGRGVAKQNIVEWLSVAGSVAGFIGFAVGRTTWWDPIAAWREGHFTAEEAATAIASRYCEWIRIFESSRVRAGNEVLNRSLPCAAEAWGYGGDDDWN
jgi:5-dehydro-2-deoxygluconokinase